MSEPLTDDFESGSSVDWRTPHGMDNEGNARRNGPTGNELGRQVEWPTPSATPYGTSNNGSPRDGRAEYATKGKPSLEGMARLWPTATAKHDAGSRAGTPRASKDAKAHPGTSLLDAALGLTHGGPNQRDSAGRLALPAQAHWSTPQVANRKSTAAMTSMRAHGRRTSSPPGLEQQVEIESGVLPSDLPPISDLPPATLRHLDRAGLLDQGSHSTSGKPRDWPTANAADGTGGKRARKGSTLTGALPDGSKANVGLRMAIDVTENRPRGVLNSRWVAQLMGYPSDWCDVPIERLSALWETPSSRKSSRSSAARSSRRKRK
jgi:hypothetical protein